MMRLPPGRSGRLWLRERLAVAARGAAVLEQKAQALADEVRRLEQLSERTRREWADSLAPARTWLVRAVELGGGQQELTEVASLVRSGATVRVRWRSTMGAVYAAEAEPQLPDPVPLGTVALTSAFHFAAEDFRRATETAVRHAAVEQALRVVRREALVTHQRLRGIREHWVPRLQGASRLLEQRLGELEREDMVRAKWASDRLGS
jgi:V/A-type H+-transporting ATPase subunit D